MMLVTSRCEHAQRDMTQIIKRSCTLTQKHREGLYKLSGVKQFVVMMSYYLSGLLVAGCQKVVTLYQLADVLYQNPTVYNKNYIIIKVIYYFTPSNS